MITLEQFVNFCKDREQQDSDDPDEIFIGYRTDEDRTIDGHIFINVDGTGGEGQGDHASVTVSDGTQFFTHEGFYDSWEGTDWEDYEWYESEPFEYTETRYRKKNNA